VETNGPLEKYVPTNLIITVTQATKNRNSKNKSDRRARTREIESMEREREQQVYLARLAEQAERYDGMCFVQSRSKLRLFISFLLSFSFYLVNLSRLIPAAALCSHFSL
jgi:hypothetical protein